MRLKLGKITENENKSFDPDGQNWLSLKEPPVWVFQLISFPIGVVTVFILLWLWSLLVSLGEIKFALNLWILVWIAGIVIVHEFIHALFHPRYGISRDTIIGFWPAMMLFYAYYNGPMSKWRLIAVLFAPFAVLSIAPLLFCAIFQYHSNLLLAVSLLNGLVSCGDLFYILLAFWGIPSNATVQNKGWKTYYNINQS